MNLSFTKIINEIEAEIRTEYLPFAIDWADKNFDGGWSNAIDRLDRAITISGERMDDEMLRREALFYKETVLGFIREYKKSKGIDDAKAFLLSISEGSHEQVH